MSETAVPGEIFHPNGPLNGHQFIQAVGHEFAGPHGSAYGTENEADFALGRARRFRNYSAMAKKSSATDELSHTAAVLDAGSQLSPLTQGMM